MVSVIFSYFYWFMAVYFSCDGSDCGDSVVVVVMAAKAVVVGAVVKVMGMVVLTYVGVGL